MRDDPTGTWSVRRAAASDAASCAAIVAGMPDYFTDDVPAKVEVDLPRCLSWVAVDEAEDSGAAGAGIVGLAIVERRAQHAAEVLWIAVDEQHRRTGIGTALLDQALGTLAADGVRIVEAKTLDQSAGYEPYIATRSFWERQGFVQVDMIDPLPDWQPGNPAAIYVAALSATR